MKMYITVTPAYGRDYKSKSEVLKDWNDGKDFKVESINASGYINKQDAPNGAVINVRYNNLKKICQIKINKS